MPHSNPEPMANDTAVDRLRALFSWKSVDDQEYEPLGDSDDDVRRPVLVVPEETEQAFSWFEYGVFFMLGVAMLWAWNMFLAAAPYFQSRFQDNPRILSSFQSSITSVACVTNLGSMLILSRLQLKANYPRRILKALMLNIVVFTLLSFSTKYFRSVSAPGYLAFTLLMVFTTSVATGFCQNGAFAFASSFARPEYIQAIMTGQAVAGVLPALAQIASVLAIREEKDNWGDAAAEEQIQAQETASSAFVYFLTATGISVITLFTVYPLIRKHYRLTQNQMSSSILSIEEAQQLKRSSVSMKTLYKKLHWLAASVFLCFMVSMFFPVFTQKVLSVVPADRAPKLFKPSAFIPIGFLLWNLGDLCGRLLTIIPVPVLTTRPKLLFLIAILRGVHLPLYLLCNIEGKGAIIKSDAFYLFVIQFSFGLTNGWVSSLCMMSASDWVEDSEREATGGFMAVNLVAGLTTGSLLSFAVSSYA